MHSQIWCFQMHAHHHAASHGGICAVCCGDTAESALHVPCSSYTSRYLPCQGTPLERPVRRKLGGALPNNPQQPNQELQLPGVGMRRLVFLVSNAPHRRHNTTKLQPRPPLATMTCVATAVKHVVNLTFRDGRASLFTPDSDPQPTWRYEVMCW
ncbi:uncharacterized protein M421DRAFT_197826 [Didymella exigua CBS 183.55]|uniref:Uncharacterized protein n=1 Tax=Didymella exigua CBS 183.55 TaxID=1150837 RepID=A0A6A5S0R7_9PLEO|nr:uncharacterized protein M421DRAFT_197826 [Didymella exigua CBS 183.55]KAF1933463.1 hypothetical protein M421DRAFT_197826 [Didymella exigua CBS 183.55]